MQVISEPSTAERTSVWGRQWQPALTLLWPITRLKSPCRTVLGRNTSGRRAAANNDISAEGTLTSGA